MKRNIAILFAAAVLSAQSAYAAEKKDWTDHWASAAIGKWYEQGLAKGVENGDFQPDREITRAEFVTLANRCMNFTKTADTNFNDISGTWFEPQVKIAAAAGYISGYPDNSFRPANAVTRAEAASIITGLLGLDKNNAQENVQSFDDYEDIPEWSRSAVGAAYREGFIKGYPDNTFRAERSLTRAEAVTLLDNIISGTAVAVDTTENTADESDKYSGEEKIWIGWLIDYDCVGADPSKHKQECNLMESCIESGEGILLTDTSSTNNAGVWIPFDSESQKQAAGLNKSLAANKYIPTIRVTGHLVANDLASDAGKDTKYPDAIHLSSIEAVYISDISNDELKAFENVSPTDYKKTSDAGSSGAGSGSSSSLKTESGVTVTTEFSDLWTDNISVKVGESVKWYVNVPAGTNLNGCGATIKIPGLGWGTDSYNKEEGHLQLAEGSNLVYEFTPAEEADILFTCWMGSSCHKNYIHVTADGTYSGPLSGSGNAMGGSSSSGKATSVKEQETVTAYSDLWNSDIAVKVGVPVKWYVEVPEGTTPKGCGATIKIPGLGWGTDSYNKEEGHLTLAQGKNLVYEFTPNEETDILFTCRMGSSCHKNYIHVTADGTYVPPIVPDAPEEVKVSRFDDEAVAVFSAAESNGTEITGYTVKAYEIGKRKFAVQASGTESPITIEGLDSGKSYEFTVTAESTSGSSAESVRAAAEEGQKKITQYGDLWSGDIAIKVGVPVKWYVNVPEGTEPKGCGSTIKIPGLGWGTDSYNKEEGHLTLAQGNNLVYEFTPNEETDILFTCRMGSSCHKNHIHVTADGTYTSAEKTEVSGPEKIAEDTENIDNTNTIENTENTENVSNTGHIHNETAESSDAGK